MKRNAILVLCLIICLCCAEPVNAKSKVQTYNTCFMDKSGNIKWIKKIAISGNKLTVVGTLKRGKTILKAKKRIFKISKKAKYYIAEDISEEKISKKEFSKMCSIASRGPDDIMRAFEFKVKDGKVIKMVYYP